jgi:N-methylhydantoinase A/oxoprolinase/acetone carboxylase beta subunit
MEIGVDTGGTFTDFVCRRDGAPDVILKVPSTPDDPSRAVLDGLRQLLDLAAASPAQIRRFVHGTTVATNAVLERKGARTGLLTTAGFRDVLEIGRQMRTAIYKLDLDPETPGFLAPGARRAEVPERLAATGEVVVPLDEDAVIAAADRLVAEGCEALAICFLFSFLNPDHELRAAAMISEKYPEVALSLSSAVDPAFREYERTVVTAFDAYTKPVLTRYLDRMAAQLAAAGVTAPLQVMQSRGGVSAAATATQRPVRLFLSGPAAGVVGGGRAAREAGFSEVMTLDIGGTSCDIALITGGKPLVRPEGNIDGYPVRVPMVDVNAIGSGGGSIAWLDAAGGLRVGPQSAGADPGPACYGRGGNAATVTDASLVLGWLNPSYFAGGALRLEIERARGAIETAIATPLGLTVEQAALGIHRVVNAQMAEAMRLVSIRQGFDPRDFALVALGGAGPLHAVPLAEELSIATVVVPRYPGVLSASGLLSASIEHEVAVGFPRDLADTTVAELRDTLAQLDRRCAALMAGEVVESEAVCISYAADVCYVGQSHYLEVPVDLREPEPLAAIYRCFVQAHEQVFGYATTSPARLVNLRTVHRVEASEKAPTTSRRKSVGGLSAASLIHSAESTAAQLAVRSTTLPVPAQRAQPVSPRAERPVLFESTETPSNTPIYDRATLAPGHRFSGPAIVEQEDTTTVVHPGWSVEVVTGGNILLTQG